MENSNVNIDSSGKHEEQLNDILPNNNINDNSNNNVNNNHINAINNNGSININNNAPYNIITNYSTSNVNSKKGYSKKNKFSPITPNMIKINRIRRREKRINKLMEQSNKIKNSYKPGVFEEVINGPRGPDVRLHRHTLIVGLLKLLLILFLTAGIVLLSVIMLCITVNVGYVCVQIDDVNSFVQLLFFAFYFDALYYIIRSFWRTYLRSIHTILDARFGSSVNDIFIKRVLGYFLSLNIAKLTMPDKYKDHPKDWYEKINLFVFILFIFLCFLPVIIIAYIYGYWGIAGTLCLLFVGGGAVTVVFLNLFSRLVLFIKFFRRLDEYYYNAPFYMDIDERIKNQKNYLRLTYCTTNRLDGGENPIDYTLNSLIHMIVSIGVAAFIFGSFDPDVWKITIIIISLVIILPIRYRKIFYKLLVKIHILSKEKMEKKDEIKKNKVNAEMDATHKDYVNNKKKNSIKVKGEPKLNWVRKITSKTSLSNLVNKKKCFNNSKSNLNGSKTDITDDINNINNNNNNNNSNNNNNNNNNMENENAIQINIAECENVNIHSMNEIKSDIDEMNNLNSKVKNNSVSFIDMNQDVVAPSSNIPSELKSKSKDDLNSEYTLNSSNSSGKEIENDNFSNILNSDKSYIRRKTLLTWDINILTSWKGCTTVFINRCIKYFVGITFMAFLNYYRYSDGADEETTYYNLIQDIFTHFSFIVLLLGQDILYLLPTDSFLSMKNRKIGFIVLLIIEFCYIIGMRFTIKNNYIPMAFIVLAYDNFTVYPDPRYTWDDESVERKTFFDLFKPDLNLRSNISYSHFGKSKGYISKNSDKKFGSKLFKLRKEDSNHSNHNAPKANNPVNSAYSSTETLDASSSNINITSVNNNKELNTSAVNINDNTKGKNKESSYYEYSLSDNEETYKSGDEIISIDSENESPLEKDFKNNLVDSININKKIVPKEEFLNVIKDVRSEMQYKRNTRARYNSTAILFISSCLIFISIIVGIVFSGTPSDDISYSRDADSFFSPKPAICQWRGDDISINEFAALSCACYYTSTNEVLYSWLYGRPLSSTNNFTIGENNINSETGVRYVDFINNSTNTIVVAVRGTITAEDIFQDIYMWSASALLQLSGFFGTFIKFWPRETIAGLVNFIVKQFTNLQLLYFNDVEEHVKKLRSENPTTNIYLTGHSLGGGIAGVISAHQNIPAITFSSPGLGYSYKTYDIVLKDLINNFVNVVPMSDPVPLLDSQVGQIQTIECNSGEPLSCHSIYNTIDTLNSMCREVSSYRYWDSEAEKIYNGGELPFIMKY